MPNSVLTSLEAGAKAVENALSRFHVNVNGWLLLLIVAVANVVGVFTHW